MKKRTIIFLGVFLVVAAMWFSRKIIYRVVVTTHLNEKLAEFELKDLDGNLILSADYKGKVLVLDFWTTWCGMCLKAFPNFQEVYEKFKDHPDVAFVAVNMGRKDPIAHVRAFIDTNGYSFPVAYDEGSKVSDRFEINHLPTLLVIDKSGRIRIRHIGYSKAMEDYATQISEYIEEFVREARPST